MSGLDGWIGICRRGEFTDSRGERVVVDNQLLDELAAEFANGDPVPVVVGHPQTDAPAFAWLNAVRRVGDTLQARLRDVADEFRAAVESGRYANRSISFSRDSAGRARLRHLGFLGGAAPAVAGLTPTQFAAGESTLIEFTADSFAVQTVGKSIARVLQRLREKLIADESIDEADKIIPEYEIENLRATPAPSSMSRNEDTPVSKTKTEANTLDDERAALAAEREKLNAERTEFTAAQTRATSLAAAESAVKPLVETDGKILPTERANVTRILAALPDDKTDTVEFAAPEENGEIKTEQLTPRAAFLRFLSGLQPRVELREIAASGEATPKRTELSGQQLAEQARALSTRDKISYETAIDQILAQNSGGK